MSEEITQVFLNRLLFAAWKRCCDDYIIIRRSGFPALPTYGSALQIRHFMALYDLDFILDMIDRRLEKDEKDR